MISPEHVFTGPLTLRELIWQTWRKINEHEILTRASAIAFDAMMAFIPFMALVLTVCVQFLPDMTDPTGSSTGIGNLTVEQLESALKALFPPQAYRVIADQIARLQSQPPLPILSVSIALTLWMASNLYMSIIDALNRTYGTPETRSYWRLRLTAVIMTLVEIVILLAAFTLIVAWPQIEPLLGLDQPQALFASFIKWIAVFIMILLSFALAFHAGPNAPWRHKFVTPGSIFGTTIFIAASLVLSAYLQNFAQYEAFYGSLGGVMMLMFWFWVSALVLLVAAELNQIIGYASFRRERARLSGTAYDRLSTVRDQFVAEHVDWRRGVLWAKVCEDTLFVYVEGEDKCRALPKTYQGVPLRCIDLASEKTSPAAKAGGSCPTR